jgi:hypothetical protein
LTPNKEIKIIDDFEGICLPDFLGQEEDENTLFLSFTKDL